MESARPVMLDLDWGRSVSGYGWLTFIDRQRAHLLDEGLLEGCVSDGLRVTELGATYAIELPEGPVCSPQWYDRVDALLAPLRVERRAGMRGGHTEDTMRTLSALDAALCFAGNAMVQAPTRHPDWLPSAKMSKDARDELWPDKHHRPPLSWYESGPE